jgi:hypothetical protein
MRLVNSTSAQDYGFDALIDPLYSMSGGAADGNTATRSGAGAGGPGSPSVSGSVLQAFMGGGGGGSTSAVVVAGGSALGGGGGGASSSATGPATSGIGGPGIVSVRRIG